MMGRASQDDVKLVKASGLFDEQWYLGRYLDVAILGMDPVEHYLWLGGRLGRDPSLSFSTLGYLELYKDVAASDINPLIHYLKFGRKEGRVAGYRPNPSRPFLQMRTRVKDRKNRVGVFAIYLADGELNQKVEWYLSALGEVCDKVIVVADHALAPKDLERLRRMTPYILAERHREYDFGSYKRGIQIADDRGFLRKADELVLCNDSCFGPIDSFVPLMEAMEKKEIDFWGMTANNKPTQHLQSYFLVFRRRAFETGAFRDFFEAVEVEDNVQAVILKYETQLTGLLEAQSLRWEAFVSPTVPASSMLNGNPVHNPVRLLKMGMPLVKVKALNHILANDDGIPQLISEIRRRSPDVCAIVESESEALKYADAPKVGFSIIMPLYNRVGQVFRAIDSVMSQTHQNFELIIVDDCSDDGGPDAIEERYSSEISSGKIILERLKKRSGVSAARNAGLRMARKDWIAYLDSDNAVTPGYLICFASSIVTNPDRKSFYARWRNHTTGMVLGAAFDRERLKKGNYIDLGVFVHRRDLLDTVKGFNEDLKRLVDWDLILRITADHEPLYIEKPVMIYWDDDQDRTRISVRESLDVAIHHVKESNDMQFTVTTIIPAYNHQDFIEAAVQSALDQRGDFKHEIIVCSDGSTDATPTLVAKLRKEHGSIIRNLSTSKNEGISETFRRCISAATGDFIAVLEGDDVWTDELKLQKQLTFLRENDDCSMVFSKILVKRLPGGEQSFLDRQTKLNKNKLTGDDFLADPSMNLIANFSSCMFRANGLKKAPKRLFENRFNEIALAFYLETLGKIGFINEPMSVYHQHEKGVWTGSTREQQLRSGIETREMVLDVAHPRYRARILDIIEERYKKPLTELEAKLDRKELA
ncbi:hypothetical protein CYG48_05090 [Neorhizobium sp. SOG26]|uniref:glycosyltransferase n=1 Tax=Neorhizobium sp. SOG26 TaxID=2060726 RepID=UPI000E573E09|nr:glycosyltransferase [Neorhizobium sp. SOG26]AXV15129.1 hypothetical protein CYG48_05090 [Neorhizobium sp. SOG26]